MRPSRSTGGAGAAHSPLGAMNRAGLAILLAGGDVGRRRLPQRHAWLDADRVRVFRWLYV
jgi:hypothetical protein